LAWAVFTQDFEFDFRPLKACCQIYRASSEPQELPERVVTAAIAAGAAVRAQLTDQQKREIKRARWRNQRSNTT